MRPAPRRFTILDGLVLIAATAAGLAVPPRFLPSFSDWNLPEVAVEAISQSTSSFDGEVFEVVSELVALLAVPILVSWSLAVLALSLRRPRPPLRRLMRRPGASACVMASATFLLTAAVISALLARFVTGVPREHVYAACILHGSIQAGLAVACGWATLLLTRTVRPEPTWVDRLGRLVGVCWIVLVPIFVVFLLPSFPIW